MIAYSYKILVCALTNQDIGGMFQIFSLAIRALYSWMYVQLNVMVKDVSPSAANNFADSIVVAWSNFFNKERTLFLYALRVCEKDKSK